MHRERERTREDGRYMYRERTHTRIAMNKREKTCGGNFFSYLIEDIN